MLADPPCQTLYHLPYHQPALRCCSLALSRSRALLSRYQQQDGHDFLTVLLEDLDAELPIAPPQRAPRASVAASGGGSAGTKPSKSVVEYLFAGYASALRQLRHHFGTISHACSLFPRALSLFPLSLSLSLLCL